MRALITNLYVRMPLDKIFRDYVRFHLTKKTSILNLEKFSKRLKNNMLGNILCRHICEIIRTISGAYYFPSLFLLTPSLSHARWLWYNTLSGWPLACMSLKILDFSKEMLSDFDFKEFEFWGARPFLRRWDPSFLSS